MAGVAFGAGDGHQLAVFVTSVALPVPTTAGTPSSRAMIAAGAAAAVGDDGGGALHHRFPVRVGHVGDSTSPGCTRSMSLSVLITRALPAPIFCRWRGLRPARAALERKRSICGVAARLHRFRARLHDVELAGDTVLAHSMSIGRP
jgi:hypothetical protein